MWNNNLRSDVDMSDLAFPVLPNPKQRGSTTLEHVQLPVVSITLARVEPALYDLWSDAVKFKKRQSCLRALLVVCLKQYLPSEIESRDSAGNPVQ